MAKADDAPTEALGVIWGKCWKKKLCVFGVCKKVKACVRILEKNDSYFLEIQLFGERVRYKLVERCYPAFEIGIGRIKVCAWPVFKDNKLVSLRLKVKVCIGFRVDSINAEKCWVVYNGRIKFTHKDDLVKSPDVGRLETPEVAQCMLDAQARYLSIDADSVEEEAYFQEDFDDASFERIK